ncbi:DUF6152 family protein [Alteraurantiacibacter aquimixticola]|uniref:Uncharacterized protein n=1 Tax=Alteraurantiacibacter aquimixticola TaxID=2489173 RepID=A0A4T3EWY2_9SPHN|nr:DUF6152 family protein [Alteraurantiacibacter aquimixticola]TIX49076.1 hypothetical protein E5222_15220 [Alteraurantiacibacter aquimixticola]
MKAKTIRSTVLGCAAALAGAAMLSVPGSAHHSTAMFAWGQEEALSNMTVQKWEWTNPHTFLYAVDADGNRWAFEGMSPNHLVRYGWSRRSLAPGQVIDLTYYPLRDDRNGGFNVTVTRPDGTTLNQFGEGGSRQ